MRPGHAGFKCSLRDVGRVLYQLDRRPTLRRRKQFHDGFLEELKRSLRRAVGRGLSQTCLYITFVAPRVITASALCLDVNRLLS